MAKYVVKIYDDDLYQFFNSKKDSSFAILELIVFKYLKSKFINKKIYCQYEGFDFAVFDNSKILLFECKCSRRNRPRLNYAQWWGLWSLFCYDNINLGNLEIYIAHMMNAGGLGLSLVDEVISPIGKIYIYRFDYVKFLLNTKDFTALSIMETPCNYYGDCDKEESPMDYILDNCSDDNT